MEFRVSLTPRARRDLADIWKFIARDDRDAATKFCGDLARHAYTLVTFPDRATELRSRPLIRKIPFKAYLIFYKIDEEHRIVHVLRFWHSTRDQRRLRLKETAPIHSITPATVPAA